MASPPQACLLRVSPSLPFTRSHTDSLRTFIPRAGAGREVQGDAGLAGPAGTHWLQSPLLAPPRGWGKSLLEHSSPDRTRLSVLPAALWEDTGCHGEDHPENMETKERMMFSKYPSSSKLRS